MKTPEWLMPGLYGAVLGATAFAVLGFNWGGWETAAGVEKRSALRAASDVTAALVPVCLERARADPERAAKLDLLKAAPLFNRAELVMKSGWAIPPGAEKPDRALAQSCLQALEVSAP